MHDDSVHHHLENAPRAPRPLHIAVSLYTLRPTALAVYSVADAHAAAVSCKVCFQHGEAGAC